MADPADPDVVSDIELWLTGDLPGCAEHSIGGGYQAAIRLIERPDGRQPVVVKEARSQGLFGWLRKATLRREYKAYRKLAGIKGIPHCFGLLHDRYLIIDHIPGQSLREAEITLRDSGDFFAQLLKLIQQMHAHGVAHGDLKRKDNILVGPEGQPFIVDFGTAHFQRADAGVFRRWLFGFIRQTDYNAWVKRKYRRDYRHLTSEDRALYRPLPLEMVARLIRESWRQLTFRRLRKRLRSRD